MSDLKSALPGARGGAATEIREAGLTGMVTLRGDLSDPGLRAATEAAAGAAVPDTGGISLTGDGRAVAWMSPDELLIVLPHEAAAGAVQTLGAQLSGQHHLVQDVSDARAHFIIEGAGWRDVVARLSPMDLRGFGPGQMRRTRFAQAPAALWLSADDTAHLVCFRSVAHYMFDLLDGAARSGDL